MKLRSLMLVSASLMTITLAHGSSSDPEDPVTSSDHLSRVRPNVNPAPLGTPENPVCIRYGVGYNDHLLLTLKVKNLDDAHVTITTSDPDTKLINRAQKSLPPYILVPIEPSNPNRLKLVPDMTGYDDLHGKEFPMPPFNPLTDEEKSGLGKTFKLEQSMPLDMMIPKSDAVNFDIKVNVRANGYAPTSKTFTIGEIFEGIVIEGFPSTSKIEINGLMF
jgi:hypothetical protein